MRARASVVVFAILSQLACASSSTQRTEGVDSTRADTAGAVSIAPAVNALAFDLYRVLGTQKGNLVFSPFSVSAVMGSIYAGAAGATRTEMQQALHLPRGDASAYDGYRSLFAALDARARKGGASWTLANRAWVQNGLRLLPEFTAIERDKFGFEVGEADFKSASDQARATINQWVEQKTENRIRDLFPPGSINADMRLVLANAIYFKGLWNKSFDKKVTHPAPFHVGGGVAVPVPTMAISSRFGVGRIRGGRMIELPYRGEAMSMLVLVPDEVDGLAGIADFLSEDSLRASVSALHERQVELTMPRFTMTQPFDLTRTLAGMGMPSAFDASTADFSAMTGGRDLFVGIVVHKAFVEVNEEGTEAAAATGGGMTTTSISIPEEFHVDRPFLFLIRDRATGCILFLGRVTDPRS